MNEFMIFSIGFMTGSVVASIIWLYILGGKNN